MLSDPKKAKALAPMKTIDPLIYALHQGFIRIPRSNCELLYSPNLEHPIFTVITPYKIYTIRTEKDGE